MVNEFFLLTRFVISGPRFELNHYSCLTLPPAAPVQGEPPVNHSENLKKFLAPEIIFHLWILLKIIRHVRHLKIFLKRFNTRINSCVTDLATTENHFCYSPRNSNGKIFLRVSVEKIPNERFTVYSRWGYGVFTHNP